MCAELHGPEDVLREASRTDARAAHRSGTTQHEEEDQDAQGTNRVHGDLYTTCTQSRIEVAVIKTEVKDL